jgi:hypothetical protein
MIQLVIPWCYMGWNAKSVKRGKVSAVNYLGIIGVQHWVFTCNLCISSLSEVYSTDLISE